MSHIFHCSSQVSSFPPKMDSKRHIFFQKGISYSALSFIIWSTSYVQSCIIFFTSVVDFFVLVWFVQGQNFLYQHCNFNLTSFMDVKKISLFSSKSNADKEHLYTWKTLNGSLKQISNIFYWQWNETHSEQMNKKERRKRRWRRDSQNIG